MNINLDRLERAGAIVDDHKNPDGDRVIDIRPGKDGHLELQSLIDSLKEFGISNGIAHAMAEDVHEEAHLQSMLALIKRTSE